MHFTNITAQRKDGIEWAATLDVPVDEQPLAYALFAHCLAETEGQKAVQHISRALVAAGYGVFRIEIEGLDQGGLPRQEEPGQGGLPRQEEPGQGDGYGSGFSHSVRAIEAACQWLNENMVAPSLFVGHSLGGTALLHAAANISSVKAIATIGAPFRGDTSTTPGTQEVKLPEVARLIVHSSADTVVGIEHGESLFQSAQQPKSFVSLDTADHFLSHERDARYAGSVIGAWAARHLDKPTEVAKSKEEGAHIVTVSTGRDHYFTEIVANGHALVADEPLELGGANVGPTPYNMLLSALGACTAITVRMYVDRKEWPLEEIRVELIHSKVKAEDCLDCGLPEDAKGNVFLIERKVWLKGDLLTEEMITRIMSIADRCPVHLTIAGQSVVKTSLVR